ncbi:MAG TPA: class I adenylate-forming enzyme family protein [bacterium]|nr:class I adenylate-forming enzyme family protein [bacterium]
MKTPHQIIEQIAGWAAQTPGRPAITDCTRAVTFGRLGEDLISCADFLARHEVAKGTAVGLLLPNRTLFVTALLSIARVGAVAVLFPTSLSAAELRRYVEMAGTRQVLAGSAYQDLILDAGGQPTSGSHEDLEVFAFDVPPTGTLSRDDFIVQLTSGVDQPSKLAIRTHAAVWTEIRDFAEEIKLTQRDTTLVLSSIFHSYGLIGGTLAPLCRGGHVLLQDGFDSPAVLQRIGQERPTILFGVPVLYRRIVETPAREEDDLSSLRLCFSAGAPLPQDVDEEFARRFEHRISQDYGSTEAGVITLRVKWTPHLQQSVGRPVRGRTIVIVDTHDRSRPPGEIGEVIVESSALARGYLGDVPPGTTIHQGRLHTGDLGWVDEDGYVFLVGRKSSLIHAAGVTVDPNAVEAVIARMPGVRDVAVVGTPDPAGGERVKAVVVADGVATEHILRHCRQHLPNSHLPEVVEFRTSIPRTPAGKILRRVIR